MPVDDRTRKVKSLRLVKNLARDLKRGHPWIYKNALDPRSLPLKSGWYPLKDSKHQQLAYGLFDKGSDLAFRVFALGKMKEPEALVQRRLQQAYGLRQSLISEETTGVRLIHGEGDLLPGLVVDVFGGTVVLQVDGQELERVWDLEMISEKLRSILPEALCQRLLYKPQSGKGEARWIWGEDLKEKRDHQIGVGREGDGKWGRAEAQFLEHGLRWTADVFKGQKTGFFLDQRENRKLIRNLSFEKTVLNVFCYTGGFSIAAGAGGAKRVVSVDISRPAIEAAKRHWTLNELAEASHEAVAVNAFDYFEGSSESFDLVIVDPPAFATSRAAVEKARMSYEKIFAEAAKKVVPGGLLALSSCSRPVDFEIFYDIVIQSLSKARRVGQVVHVSGQPMDHPFPHICPELRYLKFFLLRLE